MREGDRGRESEGERSGRPRERSGRLRERGVGDRGRKEWETDGKECETEGDIYIYILQTSTRPVVGHLLLLIQFINIVSSDTFLFLNILLNNIVMSACKSL